MDRPAIAARLVQAERHVLTAQAITARQRGIIAELERDGHNTRLAQQLLDSFIGLEEAHITDRDELRRKLAAPPD
jgi:hypothetical protein